MPKSDKFTVQVKSTKGMTAAQVKSMQAAINKAVKTNLGSLDLKGRAIKFPGGQTQGIIAEIKEMF